MEPDVPHSAAPSRPAWVTGTFSEIQRNETKTKATTEPRSETQTVAVTPRQRAEGEGGRGDSEAQGQPEPPETCLKKPSQLAGAVVQQLRWSRGRCCRGPGFKARLNSLMVATASRVRVSFVFL